MYTRRRKVECKTKQQKRDKKTERWQEVEWKQPSGTKRGRDSNISVFIHQELIKDF